MTTKQAISFKAHYWYKESKRGYEMNINPTYWRWCYSQFKFYSNMYRECYL